MGVYALCHVLAQSCIQGGGYVWVSRGSLRRRDIQLRALGCRLGHRRRIWQQEVAQRWRRGLGCCPAAAMAAATAETAAAAGQQSRQSAGAICGAVQ